MLFAPYVNSYKRFRLALTEEEPTIRPYYEDRWAELNDSRTDPVEYSLELLDALHKRWMYMLDALSEKDFSKTFRHPDLGVLNLDQATALYAWHGRHHIAQITSLRERMDW